MATIIDLNIEMGQTINTVKSCPTAVDTTAPVIKWSIPEGIVQHRFNIRIENKETGQVGLFILGTQVSSETIYQYPIGVPMSAQFYGLCTIEIAVSENPSFNAAFEYSSGEIFFVLDTITERLYNTDIAYLQWSNSVDINIGQQIYYNLLVSEEPTFENEALLESYIVPEDSGSAFTKKLINIDSNKTYFWKVRANDGYDYGEYSLTHGFQNLINYPPGVVINSIFVTNNEYGDVEINFTIDERDSEYVYLYTDYTGGGVGTTRTKMSLINATGQLNDGTHTVTWRSGRDEEEIKADDYVIYFTAYDSIGAGVEGYYGPFTLDNTYIGGDQGGIGTPEIEFPIQGYVAQWIENNYDIIPNAVEGNIRAGKENDIIKCSVQGKTSTWKAYSMGAITKSAADDTHYNFGFHYPYYHSLNYDRCLVVPQGISLSYNHTAYGIGSFTSYDDPDSIYDSDVVLTLDFVNNDGRYPIGNESTFSRVAERKGYVRFKKIRMRDREFCIECAGRGWKVSELLDNGDGTYQRQECSYCNGSRFSDVKLSSLACYTISDYKPLEDWFAPDNREYMSAMSCVTPYIVLGSQWIYGSPHGFESRWPSNERFPDINLQKDCELLANPRYGIQGIYPWLSAESFVANNIEYDYSNPGCAVSCRLGPEINVYEQEVSPIRGYISLEHTNYVAGYSPSEARGFINRDEPTHPWERGIWAFSGSITSVEPLESLKFIYLQTGWDKSNTLHWQSTMSSVTRIHLQVAKYFEDGSHSEYVDVRSEGAEYNANADAYFVAASSWSAYWDIATTQFLEEGYDYRLRIRQFDVKTNTSSQWIYSGKFNVNRHSANPANITETFYEKWEKRLYITFRVDDSQDDLYDITRVWYSPDGDTFYEINHGHLKGGKHALESISTITKEDNVTPQNIHTIIWDTSSYNLEPGDKYRIRIEVIPTKFLEGVSSPHFKWSAELNPILSYAELKIMELAGATQSYVYNQDTESFETVDPPISMPGLIDRLEYEKQQFELTPEPSGRYEFIDASGVIIDPSGHNLWLQTEVSPGITRSDILYHKAEELIDLRKVQLPYWISIRDDSEKTIRKKMIDQGFYCNGFIDNNAANKPFRFRVENMAYGEDVLDAEGNYEISYSSRYEVYYRFQMDFNSSYNSQLGGRPLRDFLFNKYGERIQGGVATRKDFVTQSEILSTDRESSYQWDSFGDNIGQPWDTEQNSEDPLYDNNIQDPIEKSEPIYISYTLPKDSLPGMWNGHYVNNTYNSVTDTLPDDWEDFNGYYFWRVAAYNIVTGTPVEEPFAVITNIDNNADVDYIDVEYLLLGDESVQEGSLFEVYYSLNNTTPAWSGSIELEFPTDRPEGYEAQDEDNPVIWVPQGANRTRPAIIKTSDHQYYMWYSKKNPYGEDCIIHSRGKSAVEFGEYDIVHPNIVSQKISEYNNMSSIYSPCIVYNNGLWHMWVTMFNGSTNIIAYSVSSDADNWSKPTLLTGLGDAIYSPFVLLVEDTFVLWYCKHDGISSKIYMADSVDGIDFNPLNSGNAVLGSTDNINTPCIVSVAGGYIMYYTKYIGAVSHIYSSTSVDSLTWSNEQVELSEDDVLNPCVIIDYYGGNPVYRMYYNKINGGDYELHTTVRYTRSWIKINTSVNNFVSMDKISLPSSKFNQYEYTARINLNGYVPQELRDISETDDVQLRLFFVNDSNEREYYVQSSWVDSNLLSDIDFDKNPDIFSYNTEIQYMNFGDDF